MCVHWTDRKIAVLKVLKHFCWCPRSKDMLIRTHMVIWWTRWHSICKSSKVFTVQLNSCPAASSPFWPHFDHFSHLLSLKHRGPTIGHRWIREQMCSVCSAVSEAFGTVRTASAPIQHAKSEKVGCWPSEPLDTLIGCVLAVWPFWLAVC